MAYIDFDPTQPDGGADNGPAVIIDLQNNASAIRDTLLMGLFKGYNYAQSGGTAERPGVITLTKGTYIVRLTLTWTDVGGGRFNITSIKSERSANGGGAWDTIQDPITLTYDASGNLTATANGGGFLAKFMQLWGNITKVVGDLAAHIVATGTAVHGNGTAALANLNNMIITGGSINATPVGVTTPDQVRAKRVREAFVDKGAVGAGLTVDLDWSAAAHYAFTAPASGNNYGISFSGLPAAGDTQTIVVEIINGGRSGAGAITYPANTKWIGGAGFKPPDNTLEVAGRNFFSVLTRDGGARLEWMHLGKGG